LVIQINAKTKVIVHQSLNKNKVINDPVYGLVHIRHSIIYDLIEHPYFHRLRRIKQLGLSGLVYPGALHTRFQHVIGAMSLTQQAVDVLRNKKIDITAEEEEAVCIAVLLHDLGHGPYSHTLERIIIPDISHEAITIAFMHKLNITYQDKLSLAIEIFMDKYPKRFLHQLVSGQLDMDRLDYLRRDSFYTGVQEGVIGHDRIIQMLNVHENELVIDEKGIYSIEKFLIARRLMYWQVYLHKTVLAAEEVLIKILKRAKELASHKIELFATPEFSYFLYNQVSGDDFLSSNEALETYSRLDDFDVFTSIKVWCNHNDMVLSELCKQLVYRRLPKVELTNEPINPSRIEELKIQAAKSSSLPLADMHYFVFTDSVSNKAYSPEGFNIKVLYRNGTVKDIVQASDLENIQYLSKAVRKYFLCYPKNV
jgi:HD superfamily phosphohydrolase